MKNFIIVTNDGKDVDLSITKHLIELLEGKGYHCSLAKKGPDHKIISESIPEDAECALVIGGDGSLIEAARVLYDKELPILGINMGTLGYLTEVEVSDLEDAVEHIAEGRYEFEKRMMLESDLGDNIHEVALNDIVISRKGGLRVVHFTLYVNGEMLNQYEADGVIIATPTGSTAYNLSAGGPIVEPTAEMIVVTPICSHDMNVGSIVLSANDEIMIEIGYGRMMKEQELYLTFDGTDMFTVKTNDRILVNKAKNGMKLMRLNKISFLETLHRKMKG